MEASFVVAATGLTTSAILYHRKEHPFLWMTVFYFSLMETLQAFTYIYIGDCNSQKNQILTLLGAYHIAFQPIFTNLFALYWLPEQTRAKLLAPVMLISASFSVVMLVNFYPFGWASHNPDFMIFGEHLCAKPGDWHIAWYVPTFDTMWLKGMAYVLPTLILPLLYGSWKFAIINYVCGFLFGYLSSGSMNEAAAVWCLVSFAYLMMCAETPLKKRLYVTNWYGLKFPKFLS